MNGADAPRQSLIEDRLEIETPERVKIAYDLAGIGTRFAAGTIDVFLLGFWFMVVGTGIVLTASVALPRTAEAQMAFWLAAGGLFTGLLTAYYVGFEWLWSGQTPGKRSLRLRVISENGAPAPLGAIVLRNVLRVADLLPGVAPYALGGIVMFVNPRSKRIGDFAAGTIVVRERADPLFLRRLPDAAGGQDDVLDADDLVRVRAFVSRARDLFAARRNELAREIADDIAGRYRLAAPDAEALLRQLAAGRTPRELRDLEGPPT